MKIKRLLFSFFFCTAPLTVHGAAIDFVPRIGRTTAVLTVDSEYKSITNKSERNGSESLPRTTDTLGMRESLGFGANGYVYHPNLFVFDGSVSGIKSRTRGEVTVGAGPTLEGVSKNRTEGYNFHGELLRRKPLSAEIDFSQSLPFYDGSAETETFRNVVSVSYIKRPFVSGFDFVRNERSNRDVETLDDQYRLSAAYSIGNFSVQGGGTHSRTHSESKGSLPVSILTESNSWSFNNRWQNKVWDFKTAADWQETENNEGERSSYTVAESIEGELPWNTEMRVNLRRVERASHPKVGGLSRSIGESAALSFTQKVYDSLTSNFSSSYSNSQSSTGSIESKNLHLGTNYTKRIRTGGVSAGLSQESSYVDRSGRLEREKYFEAKVTDPPITRADLDNELETIIRIFITDLDTNNDGVVDSDDKKELDTSYWSWNVATGELELLAGLQTYINGLDGAGDGTGNHNYVADYLTTDLDYILETSQQNLYTGFTILNGLVSGQYAHKQTAQEISDGDSSFNSGLAPIIADDKIGAQLHYGPFAFSVDYQLIKADYDDDDKWQEAKRGNPVLLNETWTYNASFHKGIAILPSVNTTVSLNYNTSFYTTEQWDRSLDSIVELSGDKYSFSAAARSMVSLPSYRASLNHGMRYNLQRGDYTKLVTGVGTNPVNSNDKDIYQTNLNANWRVPWINITITGFADYLNERFIGGNEEISLEYGARSGYQWQFGATRVNLSGNYKFIEDEISSEAYTSMTSSEEWSVNLNMVRKLF